MIRVLFVLALAGCRREHHGAEAGADAGVATVAVADAGDERAGILQVPLGHWETADGPDKLCLTLLPRGRVRFAVTAKSMREPARVFGDIDRAEALSAYDFRIMIVTTKIVTKTIGPCRRYWTNAELFEAEVLGERVTSGSQSARHGAEGDAGAEPPRWYTLHFDEPREHVEVCTASKVCRTLARKPSPSDRSYARHGECNDDRDCEVVMKGEQCDPCLCHPEASLRKPRVVRSLDAGSPSRKEEREGYAEREELSDRDPENVCGQRLSRDPGCAPCPDAHAVCRAESDHSPRKRCVLAR